MRRTAEDAADTRASIVTAASRELRRNGIRETGVSALMATLGLTHGGFYKHFGSKERLVAEAIAEAANTMSDKMKEVALRSQAADGFDTLIDWYLSAAHRENEADGCPMVSLGAEAANGSASLWLWAFSRWQMWLRTASRGYLQQPRKKTFLSYRP